MSLAMMYGELVTVQRAKQKTPRGKTTYEEVVDEGGGPLRLQCQIDRRQSRPRTVEGKEFRADATMLFAENPKLELKAHDLVVDKRGEAYRVADIEEAHGVGFGEGGFFRAFLQRTRLEVQEPQHQEGDE